MHELFVFFAMSFDFLLFFCILLVFVVYAKNSASHISLNISKYTESKLQCANIKMKNEFYHLSPGPFQC